MTLPKTLQLYSRAPKLPVEEVEPLAHDAACRRCTLCKTRKTVLKGELGKGTDPDAGTLVVVGEGVTAFDSAEERIFRGRDGTKLRPLLRKLWAGDIVLDVATRCYAGGGDKRIEVEDEHLDACRPFLANTIASSGADRIVVMGGPALYAVTGRSISPLNLRRGYTWLWNDGKPVPVFFVLPPSITHHNRFLNKFFEADLRWALEAQLPKPKHMEPGFFTSLVSTPEEAAQACEELQRGEGFAFDLEWAGYLWDADFRLLALAAAPVGRSSVWAWDEAALKDPALWGPIRALLEDPDVAKGGSNVKADQHALLCGKGIRVKGITFDTRLQRKLLEPDATANLEDMAELVGMGGHKEEAKRKLDAIEKRIKEIAAKVKKRRESKQVSMDFTDTVDSAFRQGFNMEKYAEEPKAIAYAFLDPETLMRYVSRDALSTARLASLFSLRLLRAPERQRIWDKIVLPAATAIQRVEEWGVPYDAQAGQLFGQLMTQGMEAAWQKVQMYAEDGKELNPGSPQQLSRVLYDKLGLEAPYQTDSGAPSTDEEALLHLRESSGHPLPGYILEYRHYQKQAGYADDWARCVRPGGRIHPSIHLDGARCLPGGELVLTSRGYLQVQQVRVGDLVLTHEGRARAVTATFINSERPIVRITLANGLVLRTTEDHEYMTDSGWVRANDLRVGVSVQTYSESEQWQEVAGWPYLVSSWGRVKHVRPCTLGQGFLALQPKYRGTPQGHLKVTLVRGDRKRKSGGRADFGVHQLVLRAFAGPAPSGSETRHLNGIPWDNTVGNLAWGTPAQNRADAVSHGADFAKNTRILSAVDVAYIRAQPRKPHGGVGRWSKTGTSDQELATCFGISREQIRDIRSGKKWADPRSPADRVGDRRATFASSPVLLIEMEAPAYNFGLNVEEDHSHVTAGIVTHNSGRTSCIAGWCLVRTQRGEIPMADVVIGDMVWTHRERWRPVTRTIVQGVKPIFDMNLSNGAVLTCTKDHRLLGGLGWKEATFYGSESAMDSRARGEGARALSGERKSDFAADCGSSEDAAGQRDGGAAQVHAAGRIFCAEVAEIFREQNRRQEPHEGEDRDRASQLEGPLRRRQGVPNDDLSWEAALRASRRDDAGAWGSGTSDGHDGAPHQRGCEGQPAGQPRVGDEARAQAHSLFAGEGQPLIVCTKVQARGSAQVHDLSVEEDESFMVSGVFAHNCSNPNLQNVTRVGDGDGGDGKRARDCFRAPPGKVLVQLDYSQLELRIAALLSNDTAMADLFRSGVDFHLGTAKLICQLAWNITPDQVTKVHRTGAKSFNFGIAYGKTDRSLAAELGITEERAAQIRKAIFGAFVRYGVWCKEAIGYARTTGGCWTMWEGERARWRPLWNIADDTQDGAFAASRAKNGAINTPIQGTASEFCIASISRLVQLIDNREIDAEVVLPIHDSIMLLCPEKTWKDSALAARDAMVSYPWCTRVVPLEVDVEVGEQWGSLEKTLLAV